jgi:hypothetical protein
VTLNTAIEAVETAVLALEQLAEGAAWSDAETSARAVIAEARAEAVAAIYPEVVSPTDAATLTLFALATDGWPHAALADHLAALHHRSLDTHPDLAALIRGSIVGTSILRAHDAARREGGPTPEAVRERFECTVAGQLVGRAEFEPAASRLARVLPELQDRLAADVARRRAHAEAELQRIAVEAEAARQATQRIEDQRAARVAVWFDARPRQAFPVSPNSATVLDGAVIAAALRGQALREGEPVPNLRPRLDLLEQIILAVEAAHRAVVAS